MLNKTTKGAIAVAAGVMLLLGGAGTYAWWTVSEPVAEDGTIQSGDLNLDLGQGSWTLNGDPVADGVTQVRVVPGDVLALTQPVTVTAIGDDLAAELSVSEAGLAGDPDLAENLEVGFSLPETPWATDQGDNTYAVAPSTDAYSPVDAAVTITFDEDTQDRAGTNAEVDLASVVFTLEQVPNSN